MTETERTERTERTEPPTDRFDDRDTKFRMPSKLPNQRRRTTIDLIKKDKISDNFNRRKFDRFGEPPRWVLADRTFETMKRLRSKKLYFEDYSSSSEDEGYWGNDVDNLMSD